jgi:hypothetical protein
LYGLSGAEVLQAISQGFELSAFAFANASEIALVSWPSMRTVFQPEAAKRAT